MTKTTTRPRKADPAHESWESLTIEQRAQLAAIALNAMHVSHLETRKSDRLDFPEVAVWGIREGLARAFLAGRRRAKPKQEGRQ